MAVMCSCASVRSTDIEAVVDDTRNQGVVTTLALVQERTGAALQCGGCIAAVCGHIASCEARRAHPAAAESVVRVSVHAG
jgi:bacterioferritin-associated ferredoxin